MGNKICGFCGEKLDPRALGKMFCGRECYNNYLTAKKEESYIVKKCGYCRKEYKTRNADQKYCSVKCLHEYLHEKSFNHKWHGIAISQKEWEECLKEFNNECAYCGGEGNPLHLEHFIAQSEGGDMTISNIIPACSKCNFSKGGRNVLSWYKKQSFYSVDRLTKILKYLGYIK